MVRGPYDPYTAVTFLLVGLSLVGVLALLLAPEHGVNRRAFRSCNVHVTISCSFGVLEVLQHHLRPLSCCKAVKGGAFHGGNTGSNPVGAPTKSPMFLRCDGACYIGIAV